MFRRHADTGYQHDPRNSKATKPRFKPEPKPDYYQPNERHTPGIFYGETGDRVLSRRRGKYYTLCRRW